MREIALDTETTGLHTKHGDRIIEIGCVELIDGVKTGKEYSTYINPERDISADSFRICGLSREFLSAFPKFSEIANEFLEFISDSTLVIHNAKFDVGFLNYELSKINKETIDEKRIICTLNLAKKKFPGAPATLDALSNRFKINIKREKHGALLDAQILAEVYIQMIKVENTLLSKIDFKTFENDFEISEIERKNFKKRTWGLSKNESELHSQFVKTKIKNTMWIL